MSDELPPDWAIERALTLGFTGTKLEDVKRHWPGHTAHIAFARYIAEHEEPPVDPLLIEARKIAAGGSIHPECQYLGGYRDDEGLTQAVLAALKRGMELARAQS